MRLRASEKASSSSSDSLVGGTPSSSPAPVPAAAPKLTRVYFLALCRRFLNINTPFEWGLGAAVSRDAIVRHLVLASFTLLSWRLSALCSSGERRREWSVSIFCSPRLSPAPRPPPTSELPQASHLWSSHWPDPQGLSCLWQSPLTWGQSGGER